MNTSRLANLLVELVDEAIENSNVIDDKISKALEDTMNNLDDAIDRRLERQEEVRPDFHTAIDAALQTPEFQQTLDLAVRQALLRLVASFISVPVAPVVPEPVSENRLPI